MTQILQNKIEKWNKLMLRNLFWLVPLNFLLILFFGTFGSFQRIFMSKTQFEIKADTTLSLKNDSIFKKRMDILDLKTKQALEFQAKVEKASKKNK